MSEVALLGVGAALAEAREAQGLAVADVAQQLKFMPRQIEALEAERFQSLPGPTIARGMVRSYARLLKLDPEPLLGLMQGRVDAPDSTPQLAARYSQPVPFSDSGRRSTALYLALSAGVLTVAGAMVYEWRHERAAPQFISAADYPLPAPAPAQQTASVSAAPVPPAPPEPAVEPAPPPPTMKEPAPASASATQPADEAKSVGVGRIVLKFDEESWVEVTDGLGRTLVSSLNPAGTERVVRGRAPFSLVIGNAHHVKVNYNNREVDLQPHMKVEVARFTLK